MNRIGRFTDGQLFTAGEKALVVMVALPMQRGQAQTRWWPSSAGAMLPVGTW